MADADKAVARRQAEQAVRRRTYNESENGCRGNVPRRRHLKRTRQSKKMADADKAVARRQAEQAVRRRTYNESENGCRNVG